MKFITTVFLSSILLLTACSNSDSATKLDNPPLKDSEHYIKATLNLANPDSTVLNTGWYYIVYDESGFKRQLEKSTDTFYLDPKPIVIANNFTKFEIYESKAGGQSYVGLTMILDELGTENWSVATEKAIGKQLAFILDNRLLHVASVNSQITGGVTALNRSDYSKRELENIKRIIEAEQ
jgi:preprotein translocase subunit SecD